MVLAGHVVGLELGEVRLAVASDALGGDEVVRVGEADQPLCLGIVPEDVGGIGAIPPKHRKLREQVPADKLPEGPAQQPAADRRQEAGEEHGFLGKLAALLRRAEGEPAADLHALQEADGVYQHCPHGLARRPLVGEDCCQIGREGVADDVVFEVIVAEAVQDAANCIRKMQRLRRALQDCSGGSHAGQLYQDATARPPLPTLPAAEEGQVGDVPKAQAVHEEHGPLAALLCRVSLDRRRQVRPTDQIALGHGLRDAAEAQREEAEAREMQHPPQEGPQRKRLEGGADLADSEAKGRGR
mmetsp:Transcript_19291/g.57947  ORF Transcript_19291/g.57947 Transcript_19291/m.57947 type:complete len:299 (-) Transcript_19291:351-1247(-)